MYRNDAGVRLSVLVRPDAKARNPPLSPVEARPIGGAAWIDKGVGYSVVAPVPAEELRRIAEEVRRVPSGPASVGASPDTRFRAFPRDRSLRWAKRLEPRGLTGAARRAHSWSEHRRGRRCRDQSDRTAHR